MQGAKDHHDHFCFKIEKATKYCVPPIWVGEGKMKKTDVDDRVQYLKCGASDWQLCAAEVEVAAPSDPPVPPSPPAPPWPPTPPVMPGRVYPNAPPLPPGTNIVACVDTMAQKKCLRKAQKGKCWMAKVYGACAATCKRTCVAV
jgi:hypothetical protein